MNGSEQQQRRGAVATASNAAPRRPWRQPDGEVHRKNLSASATPSATPASRQRSRQRQATATRSTSGSDTLAVWYASITGGQSNDTPYTRQSRTSRIHRAATSVARTSAVASQSATPRGSAVSGTTGSTAGSATGSSRGRRDPRPARRRHAPHGLRRPPADRPRDGSRAPACRRPRMPRARARARRPAPHRERTARPHDEARASRRVSQGAG